MPVTRPYGRGAGGIDCNCDPSITPNPGTGGTAIMSYAAGYGGFLKTSTGVILVLYILLVIVLRSGWF